MTRHWMVTGFAVMVWTLVAMALPALARDEVLLTLTRPDGSEVALDRAALSDIQQDEFTTSTIWTDGPQTFRGVRLATLLEHVGVEGAQLQLVAANGYRVERDLEGMLAEDALIALERNGRQMSLREKGPVWLVYNYDSDTRLQTEVIYANSIWQLDRIEVTD